SVAAALVQLTADAIVSQLRVSRVTFAAVSPDASFAMVEFTHAYESQPISGRYSLEDFLTAGARSELVSGRPLAVSDVGLDPRTEFARDKFMAHEARAFISVPLRSDKGLQAVLNMNSATPRVWRSDEVQLLEHVAARLWPAVERARAEAALREREHRLHLALEA